MKTYCLKLPNYQQGEIHAIFITSSNQIDRVETMVAVALSCECMGLHIEAITPCPETHTYLETILGGKCHLVNLQNGDTYLETVGARIDQIKSAGGGVLIFESEKDATDPVINLLLPEFESFHTILPVQNHPLSQKSAKSRIEKLTEEYPASKILLVKRMGEPSPKNMPTWVRATYPNSTALNSESHLEKIDAQREFVDAPQEPLVTHILQNFVEILEIREPTENPEIKKLMDDMATDDL